MAQYHSEVDYSCAEERSRPYANPGFYHGEGGERYAVRKEVHEEVDEVARAGRGHQHLGHSGSHHERLGYREHDGHGGRRYDSCTGEYYG